MKVKASKTLSNILIFTAIVIGYVLAFKSKEPKYQFYFYAISTAMILLYSLFVLIGTLGKNKRVVEAIERAISRPDLIPTIVETIKGKPVQSNIPIEKSKSP